MTICAATIDSSGVCLRGLGVVRHGVRADAGQWTPGQDARRPAGPPGHLAQFRRDAVRGAGGPDGPCSRGGRVNRGHERGPGIRVRRPQPSGQRQAAVDGGGSAGRPRPGDEVGRGQARLRPGTHPRRARTRNAVGALHHARPPRRHVPGRLQQRLPDHADPGLRGVRLRDDPRDTHRPDRRPAGTGRGASSSGTASRAAAGKATRWWSRARTTTARDRSPAARPRAASAASRRARR